MEKGDAPKIVLELQNIHIPRISVHMPIYKTIKWIIDPNVRSASILLQGHRKAQRPCVRRQLDLIQKYGYRKEKNVEVEFK